MPDLGTGEGGRKELGMLRKLSFSTASRNGPRISSIRNEQCNNLIDHVIIMMHALYIHVVLLYQAAEERLFVSCTASYLTAFSPQTPKFECKY